MRKTGKLSIISNIGYILDSFTGIPEEDKLILSRVSWDYEEGDIEDIRPLNRLACMVKVNGEWEEVLHDIEVTVSLF